MVEICAQARECSESTSRNVCGTSQKYWRRRESNPHFRDATAVCSRYTTSPNNAIETILQH